MRGADATQAILEMQVLTQSYPDLPGPYANLGILYRNANQLADDVGYELPRFGDQREVELLVEAGFTPLEAIHIATANGAQYLGEADRIGTIAPGKAADLVVVKGDPSQKIEDIENAEIVFKDGVGYDTKKLLDSVKGHYGEY